MVALNNQFSYEVEETSLQAMKHLFDICANAFVVKDGDKLAAFCLTIAPGASYDLIYY